VCKVVESEHNRKRNVGLAKQGIEGVVIEKRGRRGLGRRGGCVVWFGGWVYGLRGRVEFQLSKDRP
jgi:hypothetical protein